MLNDIIANYIFTKSKKDVDYHLKEESLARPIELGDSLVNSFAILFHGLFISILYLCYEIFKSIISVIIFINKFFT